MQPGDLVADRFEIERIAGSGGMGAVYLARDRHSGAEVALKTLLSGGEDNSRRFLRESSVLYELSHPRIVRYIAHGQTPAGALYLVMEWLVGESLADRLKRASLSVSEAVMLGTRAAEGIGFAHERRIVHRDLKPANIFLEDKQIGRAKLLDFGLAHVSAPGGAGLTRTGAMLGTPGYMAPEQARGEKDIGPHTDVFALGCVLFRCIVGRTVFPGADLLAVLAKLLLEDAPRLRELNPLVPAPLDELVASMLARNPAERPADGAAVLARLRLLEGLEEVSAMSMASMASLSSPSLTTSERRVMCLVLARAGLLLGDEEATLVLGQMQSRIAAIRAAIEPLGGQLSRLLDGSLLVTVTAGPPSEQAARAARCALVLREHLGRAPIALVAGRAERSATGMPLGEAIDRAVQLLELGAGDAVRLNALAATLLGEHFEVSRDPNGLLCLSGGRPAGDRVLTLLGRQTPMVGRNRELKNLATTFEECVVEPVARVVLVTGRAGMGKSRLRHELLRQLETRGTLPDAAGEERSFAIWTARGDPMSSGAAFGMIAPIVRQALGVRAGDPVALGRERLIDRIAQRLPEPDRARVAEFLGELIGIAFEGAQSVQLGAARQEPMLMGDQMRRAFEDWLGAECAAQPVLLVLEDLHYGDLPSIQFLDAALRNHSDQPLMVLAFALPEVHELFPGLWAERDMQEVRLGPLTRKAATELVRAVLGSGAAQDAVDRIVEQAGGNAFFLEELIRALAEGRSQALPETVVAMIQGRLEALEAEGRRVLRAASVFGPSFWRGGVTALLGEDEDRLEDLGYWLDELTAKELISRRGKGRFPDEEEYVFRNGPVREAAYGMLTDQDRTLGHRLARQWLERAGERDVAVLAEHAERGGEPEKALELYGRAAEQALEGNDLGAVLALSERGISAGAKGTALGELRLLQAIAHRWRSELEAMQHAAQVAMAGLPYGSARWCGAAAELAVACRQLGQHDKLGHLATVLHDLTPEAEASAPYAKAVARVAMQLFLCGQPELGDDLLARLSEACDLREVGARDPTAVAWLYQARAFEALYAGDPSGYLQQSMAAVGYFDQAGDVRSGCNSRVHVGFAYNELGAYGYAETSLRDALSAAQRMGLNHVVATAKNNLGLALARLGRFDEAQAVETDAIRDAGVQNDRRMEGGSRLYLAVIWELRGRLQDAEREALRAAELLEVSPGLRAHALATIARIRLSQGRGGDSYAVAREAMDVLESLGAVEEGESLVRRIHAEALYATGQRPEALAAVAEARSRLAARAAKITDPAWRRCFLENVPDNARTFWPLGPEDVPGQS